MAKKGKLIKTLSVPFMQRKERKDYLTNKTLIKFKGKVHAKKKKQTEKERERERQREKERERDREIEKEREKQEDIEIWNKIERECEIY